MSSLLKSNRLMFALKSLQKASSQIHGRRFLCTFHGMRQNAKGTVSQLINSTNGAELYLVGTCHILESSAQLAKKVISVVEPNVIAVELCNKRAHHIKSSSLESKSLYQIFVGAMKVQGGLMQKFITFLFGFEYRQFRALSIFPGKEFKVAMEESERRRAQLVLIDDDVHVTIEKLCGAIEKTVDVGFSVLIKKALRFQDEFNKLGINDIVELLDNRIAARALIDILKIEFPEIARVLITDRDHLMFRRMRTLRGKVVVVVGMGHMDGIEKLWREAEKQS